MFKNIYLYCIVGLTITSSLAQAQSAQGRPIRLVIGYPAGGPLDAAARIMAPHMGEALGQSVIIDNRAGANGIIATELVAKAAPDGHTLLFGTTGNFAINPALYASLPFSITRDFAPVSHVASTLSLIYVHPSLPVKTLPEFIAHAHANPGKVHFASSGSGGIPHLAGELLNIAARINTVHVPYKGTAPAFTALLGGEVQYAISAVISGLQHVKAQRLRAIATTTKARIALLPDVPTASETLPGYEVDNWYGLLVPAGTPRAAISKLQQAVASALAVNAVREKLVSQGIEPVGSTPQVLGTLMQSELTKWAQVVKRAQVRPE